MAFAVSQLSQHLENPGIVHWKAFIHLLCYISGAWDYSITFRNITPMPQVFANADYANCVDSRCSYSAYILRWGSSVISWKAHKQPTVSLSTTKAEYWALYEGTQEVVWFSYLLQSLNVSLKSPISVLCNNQASIALTMNPMFQQRTKHIDVKFHWTREMIEAGKISVTYIQMLSMQANGLTKSLANPKHQELIGALKLAS
jgi:hypothetical protein